MNKNLNKSLFDIEKVNAVMYAIEATYLGIEVVPEELEKADKAVHAFYALWDCIKQVQNDLEILAGDETVVDAIYAVNDVKRKKCSLTTKE